MTKIFADTFKKSPKGLDKLTDYIEQATDFFSKELEYLDKKILDPLTEKFVKLENFLQDSKEKFQDKFGSFCKGLKELSDNIVEFVSQFDNKLCNSIKDFFKSVGEFAGKYADKEKNHVVDIDLSKLNQNLDKQLAAANPQHKSQESQSQEL